ncbi:MAG: NIPSNAP family containing protein [Bacteroidetes bacterium]|nr:MAG: NIPSNAP family containing protein [Bacteroidota bacterium]
MKTFKNLLIRKLTFIILFIFAAVTILSARDYYQITVYNIKDKAQETALDSYLKDAYLPAMHKAGVKKVGVFKPIATDPTAGTRVFVFIPLKDLAQIEKLEAALEKDGAYQKAGAAYINAPYDNPPYVRMESILLRAFTSQPEFFAPKFSTPKSEQIFELRSYQSATEKIYKKKVEMFNEGGESEIFKKIGANAVFYGEVLSGSEMPNLMYMTSYENMKANEECWKTFRDHPDWKKLSGLEEYKNTVSKINKYMLYPAEYSDI